jgi:hypothetical protein
MTEVVQKLRFGATEIFAYLVGERVESVFIFGRGDAERV